MYICCMLINVGVLCMLLLSAEKHGVKCYVCVCLQVLKEVCKVSQQQIQDAANKHAAKGVKRGQNTD